MKTAELAHSLAMMRATLESTTDGIVVTDGDGRITDFNQNFVEMWRASSALMDAQARPQLAEVSSEHFDDPESFRDRVREIYASSPPSSYDLLKLRDGRMLERFSRAQFIDDRNVGRVWSFRDITEQRRAEHALRKHSEWLRVTLTGIGEAVITVDVEGRVTSLNPVAELLTGWSTDDAQGMSIEDVIHLINEESRQPVENPVSKSLREGRVVGPANHTVLIARDGTEHAIGDSAAPIRDVVGNVIGVVLIFRDVSDERKAELALHRAARTTRFLADSSAALARPADSESTLQRIADLAVPIFADWCAVDIRNADGTTRRVAITHNDPITLQLVRDLQDKYHARPNETRGRASLRTGVSQWVPEIPDSLLAATALDEESLQLIRGLGLRSYISVPLKARDGDTLGALTFVMAESGRTYVADDLRAAEDLANRASIAIENSNLVEALKESDRRKDEFLAVLAHELRNPLAPVRNAVEIMRAKAPPVAELKWAGDIIDRQVEQMTRLVDDLLDVSRISRGTIDLRIERIELSRVVADAVESCRPLIERRGHALSVILPPEPLFLNADPTRLAQILLNLLNNSAKYTERGGRIWLTATCEGAQVEIRVRDTGVGISASTLPRVFEMFTQVDRDLERSQGGLGIGLTLVKRLVESHGGTVEAHSPGLGKGSEFIVRLPVAADGPAHEAPRVGDREEEEPRTLPSHRILVVDDNRDAADSLAMILQMMGHEVGIAYDGVEAERRAAELQPSIVLLDLGLPKLNGYEVARRIKGTRTGDVVLVALTGWGQAEDRRRTREAGFDFHLTKPVESDALNTLLGDAHALHSDRVARHEPMTSDS